MNTVRCVRNRNLYYHFELDMLFCQITLVAVVAHLLQFSCLFGSIGLSYGNCGVLFHPTTNYKSNLYILFYILHTFCQGTDD